MRVALPRCAIAASLGLLGLGMASCDLSGGTDETRGSVASQRPGHGMDFRAYLYDQGAEIRTFDLEQSRYGANHSGRSVMIFVTEPFDRVLQVKADNPDSPSADPALKLNFTRKFNTGVYPYSTMVSVFQPLAREDPARAWKVTTSVQEWCGMVFQQINRREDGLHLRLFSYFMSEGDQDRLLEDAWLEDAFWTRLRLDPASLPTGAVRVVPGSLYCRLAHRDPRAYAAQTTLEDIDREGAAGQALSRYTVRYEDLDRSLSITFARSFPHEITQWTESWGGGTTRGTCTHHRFLPYWQLNGPGHRALRRELGLPVDMQ